MAVIKPSFAKLWLTLHQKQKVIIIMRKKSFILLLLFISNTSLFSQNPLTEDALLEKQIYETGLIHAPLPLNTSRSFEENALKKEVLSSQPLTETEGADGWTHSGAGKMSFSKEKTTSGIYTLSLHDALPISSIHIGQREHPFIFSYLYRKKSRWFSFRS